MGGTLRARGLESVWADSPVLWRSMGVFLVVYLLGYFLLFRKWSGRPRYDAASCGISMVHGTVAAILACADIFTNNLQLDAPNSLRQDQIMEFSIAYFVIDLLHYVYAASDDYLFIGHHIATSTYMFSSRYYIGHGGASLMYLIAAGESTSPVQNVWTVARMARTESPIAKQVYTSLSPFFTVYFTLVRGVFGPYLVWTIGKFYLSGKADAVIPRWLACCWVFKISFAIFGSAIWAYKLWIGLAKFYRNKNRRRSVAAGPSDTDTQPKED